MPYDPLQIVQDYLSALMRADLSKLMCGYADTATLLTLDGAFVGKPAIERLFEVVVRNLNNLVASVDKVTWQGEIILFHWYGEADRLVVSHSVDSFLVRKREIYRHTTWHQVTVK